MATNEKTKNTWPYLCASVPHPWPIPFFFVPRPPSYDYPAPSCHPDKISAVVQTAIFVVVHLSHLSHLWINRPSVPSQLRSRMPISTYAYLPSTLPPLPQTRTFVRANNPRAHSPKKTTSQSGGWHGPVYSQDHAIDSRPSCRAPRRVSLSTITPTYLGILAKSIASGPSRIPAQGNRILGKNPFSWQENTRFLIKNEGGNLRPT